MTAGLVITCAACGLASGVVSGLLITGHRVPRWLVAYAVASALALGPAVALADPCPEARPVEPGDTVECAGLLIPEADARDALNWRIGLEHCQQRASAEAAQAAADLVLVTAERDGARMALRTVEAVAVPPPAAWYERPAVVWPTAIITGALAGAALTWSVTR